MFDPEREKLEAENARLRVILEAQTALIAELRSRLEELQSLLGKDSATSSWQPSRDGTDPRARRAVEAKERRATNKALGKAARGQAEGGARLDHRAPGTRPHRGARPGHL